MSRFHATIAISDDQPGEPSIESPKRATPKNALRAAIAEAKRDGIDEKVKIEIFEGDMLLASGYGDTPADAQREMNTMLDNF